MKRLNIHRITEIVNKFRHSIASRLITLLCSVDQLLHEVSEQSFSSMNFAVPPISKNYASQGNAPSSTERLSHYWPIGQ